MSDEQLNTAIDEVARRMTEGSPAGDAGFRRRVLARIEAGGAPPARWRPLFVVVPLASVAAIVFALVVARQAVRLKPDTTDIGQRAAQLPSSSHGVAETGRPDSDNTTTTVRLAPSPSGFGRTRKPDTTDDVRRQASRPGDSLVPAPPIDAIVTIAVAPLLVDTLTPESIQIPRLDAVVPIAVAPLDSIEEQRRYE